MEEKSEMKTGHIILGLLLCISCTCSATLYAQEKESAAYDGSKETLHLYLLIGQSNMAGRAPLTDGELGTIERCYLLNGEDKWEAAKNPLNRYSTIRKGLGMQKLNPGYSFAQAMLKADKDASLGLIVNAKGGSNIGQWARGTHFYKEALRRTAIARKTGTLKGILWHQGESDSKNPDQYLKKLKTLIENLRSDLDLPNLPFIAGQVNDAKEINDQIAKLPETVPFTGFTSSQGLTVMDRWHFDAKSMKLLGKRYADEILKIHAK